ncbi:sugar ABC transporter permease [Anaerocolumna sp. AGMB13025]|uniref:ABC transporter permease subunit n=1 Tax=Anaerocolumna sp. AGMB13025 TaxID=3039116 RepID=UPI00241E3F0F|nr:sugar ABC transporter permease [Anaerocolumna sp. AGMB13025]WFR57862.1 sugar ABC transporter permease [Anaerocolumna sp. AGMB13025]
MNVKAKNFLVKYTMVIVLVIVFLLFNMITGGKMVYAQNLSNLLLQNAYVVILACGMLLCILTGGNIDLSVGAIVCLVGAFAAKILSISDLSAFLVIILGLGLALLIGVWQGYWVGYSRIPPFITTLAGMFIFRGIGRVVLDSKTIPIKNQQFLDTFTAYLNIPGLDSGKIKYSAIIIGIIAVVGYVVFTIINNSTKKRKGYKVENPIVCYTKVAIISLCILVYSWKLSNYKGISVMLLWVLVVVFIYAYITNKSVFGRYFYAIGGNEKATKLSGINTNKIFFVAYTQVALLAGLCGLLSAARIGSVNGDSGNQYEMDAIGSCFIGGASAYGGSGTVGGAVIGAILMGIINQGMSIYGLNSNWQYVVKGGVLLFAVIFDIKFNNKNMSKA